MFTLDSGTFSICSPAATRVKGCTNVKGDKWYMGICLFFLNWTRVKTGFIWSPLCTSLYCLSSYTYTHLGFTELGTETFNINVIPGQTEEWLLEHCQPTYSSTCQCPVVTILQNYLTRLNHTQTISQNGYLTVTFFFALFLHLHFKFKEFTVLPCLCRTLQEYA